MSTPKQLFICLFLVTLSPIIQAQQQVFIKDVDGPQQTIIDFPMDGGASSQATMVSIQPYGDVKHISCTLIGFTITQHFWGGKAGEFRQLSQQIIEVDFPSSNSHLVITAKSIASEVAPSLECQKITMAHDVNLIERKDELVNLELPKLHLIVHKADVDNLLFDMGHALDVALKTSESEVVRIADYLERIAKEKKPLIEQAGTETLVAFQNLLEQTEPALNQIGRSLEATFIEKPQVDALIDDTVKNADALIQDTSRNVSAFTGDLVKSLGHFF